MPTVFRKSTIVWRRRAGKWEDGKYTPERTLDPISLPLSIQELNERDRNAVDASPWGRRQARYIKVYSDIRLSAVHQEPDVSPGDLISWQSFNFLLFGEAIFQTMKNVNANSPVSHYRYYGVQVAESTPGEALPFA